MRKTLLICLVGALAAPTAAMATDYPPPKDPGTIKKHPKGKHFTLRVCKHGKKRYRTIQSAVKYAAGGDTIRICNGTYKGQVSIEGKSKSKLKLIGNVKHPKKVLIELKGSKGSKAQNGVIINGANGVTLKGLWARHYKANGFFALNVKGYTFDHLIASLGGQYGLYAFNSKGGRMTNSVGLYNNDSAFYVGQTPKQAKPIRTVLKNVKGYLNVLGFSGTNMRYVTIQDSAFYNNGVGIVPNALKSEKYPPNQHNVLINNKIFWNNFNYYKGAPFYKPNSTSTSGADYPVGVGVIVFGGQFNDITKNKIFGNWLFGVGLVEQVYLLAEKDPALKAAGILRGNQVHDNTMSSGGQDLNGRGQVYDGEGTDNCFENNAGASNNVPADNSTFRGCPFSGTNGMNNDAFAVAAGFLLAEDHEKFFVPHPHVAIKGIKPIVECTIVTNGCKGQPKG